MLHHGQQHHQEDGPAVVDGLRHLRRQLIVSREEHEIIKRRAEDAEHEQLQPVAAAERADTGQGAVEERCDEKDESRGQCGHHEHLEMREIPEGGLEGGGYRAPAEHCGRGGHYSLGVASRHICKVMISEKENTFQTQGPATGVAARQRLRKVKTKNRIITIPAPEITIKNADAYRHRGAPVLTDERRRGLIIVKHEPKYNKMLNKSR